MFPLSNWTELDIWQYIMLENLPVVPLYFAAERPVVERDGTLIMVDDERMRLRPGEVPRAELVRFRTLGCYPLTGAIEVRADHPAGDRRRDVHVHAPPSAAGRLIDRDDRVDGEEEAGGVFLMHVDLPPGDASGRPSRHGPSAAALPDLRQRR